MIRFAVRRLAVCAVLLALVTLATFIVFYALPASDPAQLRAGRHADPETVEQIRMSLGLDQPLWRQYVDYLGGLLQGDLGYSFESDAPVSDLIMDRIGPTASLAFGAAVLWMLLGVAVGIFAALRRGTAGERAASGLALVAVSAPVYWVGLVCLYLFAEDIGVFPLLPGSDSYVPLADDPLSWAGSLLMPWFVLALTTAAVYSRLLRASLLAELHADYVRTARAKGLSRRRVVFRHATRPAFSPLVSTLGLDLGLLLGGAVLVETVFNIPGVGRMAFDSLAAGDLPVIQGTVLLGGIFIVVANLAVDVSYALLDPRVRLG